MNINEVARLKKREEFINEEQYIIHVDWDGPYTLDQLTELKTEKVDTGVYQIYGNHPIYGADILLYIGKAICQTFGVRIAQEGWDRNSDVKGLKVYVGRLAGNSTPSDEIWTKEIDLAERLLIYSHSPARNSQCIQNIPNKDLLNVHILNWGHHRDLLSEVSGARWTNKYDDMSNYEVYGEHT